VAVVWFVPGIAALVLVLDSALRTFVLPRGATAPLSRAVFGGGRLLFRSAAAATRSAAARDRIMALYAPTALLVLPMVWIVVVLASFGAMFHGLGVPGPRDAFELSGSSLLTLGFSRPPDLPTHVLAFTEAALGIGLLALLIAYIPTIYAAFSRREALVAQLAARSDEPPTGQSILARAQRMERFHLLDPLWVAWQQWFAEVEETHTSLSIIAFFRSPRPERSWVTAAGAVLDAASLALSSVDRPFDAEAGLCVRGGSVALRAVAHHFAIAVDDDPAPDDPISIGRDEFLGAVARLEAEGIPVMADREAAWRAFSGWRVNYDAALLGLAGLVMAPYAPWSSDRSRSLLALTAVPSAGSAAGRRGA
jgi:hypothetical protein